MIDLHTHTCFTDGVLVPAEVVQRAWHAGYDAVAITDHVDDSNIEASIADILRFCTAIRGLTPLVVLPGLEITHVPLERIAPLVDQARESGAAVVVVHGESPVEPVIPGTNRAAIEAGTDILAHPGLLSPEDAALAASRGVALEITSRRGHSLTNGRVRQAAAEAGAMLVINNDAHAPNDFISADMRRVVALGCGMTEEEYTMAENNSRQLLEAADKRFRERIAAD